MVRNKLRWDANNAVGLLKQKNSYQSSPTFLCFESPTALFASLHNLFLTMWLDPAKGLLPHFNHSARAGSQYDYSWKSLLSENLICLSLNSNKKEIEGETLSVVFEQAGIKFIRNSCVSKQLRKPCTAKRRTWKERHYSHGHQLTKEECEQLVFSGLASK